MRPWAFGRVPDVADRIGLRPDGPRLAGDVAARIIGDRRAARGLGDAGETAEPKVAARRRVVAVGDRLGRRCRERLGQQPAGRIVGVLRGDATPVGRLCDEPARVAHGNRDAAVGRGLLDHLAKTTASVSSPGGTRPAGLKRGDAGEPQGLEIEPVNKSIDSANWVLLANVVVERRWQQCALTAINPCDETGHPSPPIQWGDSSMICRRFHTAWAISGRWSLADEGFEVRPLIDRKAAD